MESIKHMTRSVLSRYGWLVAVMALAFVAGYMISPGKKEPSDMAAIRQTTSGPDHDHGADDQSSPTIWTCSMHPQIRLPNKGKCPICFMDLIPALSGLTSPSEKGLDRVSITETARKLAQVETEPVIRAFARKHVSMVGMVFEDETRVAALTSRVEGRLDAVYVNFTGVQVNKDDPMVKIWSPTLIRGQVELFETLKGASADDEVVRGAEEKLIQYGLTRSQIEEIKNHKKPMLNITLRAPINGIVTRKNAVLGQFVKEGAEMFIINDLSRVWVKLDAYETDIPWIRYGQEVKFKASAIPGKIFRGKVLFIDPVLDTKTRSVKVRVEADNHELLLKPGMFVSAEVDVELDSEVRVIKPEWAGKYICPIHPRDVASDVPGNCPESNMPMRLAASFGYADDPNPRPPLLIPVTAPLITGKRALVFVEVSGSAKPTYEQREVSLGPKAGSHFIVQSGLNEGERIVTKGAFKLDSTMQISARPSMMSPSDPEVHPPTNTTETPEEELIERIPTGTVFRRQITEVTKRYLSLKDALVEENTDHAAQMALELADSIKEVSTTDESSKAQEYWQLHSHALLEALSPIQFSLPVDQIRKRFETVSESLSRIVMALGHDIQPHIKLYYCSMAFDGSGAYWLESGDAKTNPYFGRKPYKGQDMLRCGELQETIAPTVDAVNSAETEG
jgi:Cu(I)/Ag(I) efflux system membrane fusion protein